jgi:hypothetical protein
MRATDSGSRQTVYRALEKVEAQFRVSWVTGSELSAMTVQAHEWAMSGAVLGKNKDVRGEILMTYQAECFGFKNVWQIDKIRIFTAIGCTDIIEQLLDWAEQFALDRSCRLIPSPALSEAGFLIWRNFDPEALLKVLIHPDAAEFVKEANGDLKRYHEQVTEICDAFMSRK